MPLTDRFELLGLKRDDGVRTFDARELATSRPVLVHLFSDPSLFSQLDALPPSERARALDRGEHEGALYLVTDRLADHAGLREWLASKPGDPAKPLNSAGAWQIKPPAPSLDTQFVSLFETAPRPVLPPSPAEPPPAPVLTDTGAQTLQLPAKSADPGEFTRLFAPPQVPRAPQPTPAPDPGAFTKLFQATPVPPAAPPPQTAAAPGEFTQMIQAQRPAERPAAPAPATPPSQPPPAGEFTGFFQSGAPAPIRPIAPAAPAPPPPNRAGEFTQIFGKGDRPSPPPAPAPAAPPPAAGTVTQAFSAPRPMPPVAAPPPAFAPPSSPQAPGEYTRMFAKPAQITFGQAPAAAPPTLRAPAPAPVARIKSRLPLILLSLGAVLLFAAILVYFLMRPHSG